MKRNLITIFLIISLIINFIMGFFIYKLYNDKQIVENKLTDLNNKVAKWEIGEDNYFFELDSENKYIIVTDSKYLTMQNDGGSNTSIYYQIDLDNNIISKIQKC